MAFLPLGALPNSHPLSGGYDLQVIIYISEKIAPRFLRGIYLKEQIFAGEKGREGREKGGREGVKRKKNKIESRSSHCIIL